MNNIEKILARVAEIIDTHSDSAIAKELGVSPQAIANARKRESVPYEKLIQFASRKNISLDDLFLGKVDTQPIRAEMDTKVFQEILESLNSEISELREYKPIDFANKAAFLYNSVCSIDDEQLRKNAINSSIIMLSQAILQSRIEFIEDHRENFHKGIELVIKPLTVRIKELSTFYPEYVKKAINEVKSPSENHSINQNIRGDGHQIARRDVVNKKDSQKDE